MQLLFKIFYVRTKTNSNLGSLPNIMKFSGATKNEPIMTSLFRSYKNRYLGSITGKIEIDPLLR